MRLKELERRLKQEPDNLGLRVTVAGLMCEVGRAGEAVELYRSVALAYRDQGRPQQAIAVCRSILELAPDDAACRALLDELVCDDEVELDVRTPPPPDPDRRPSSTPLPHPVPYHIADPTTSAQKVAPVELEDLPAVEGAKTGTGADEPRPAATGLAPGISGLVARDDIDLALELETRKRPLVDSDDLRKIAGPPPTVPVARVELEPVRDTPLDLATERHAMVPRDSEDELTQPRERLETVDDE